MFSFGGVFSLNYFFHSLLPYFYMVGITVTLENGTPSLHPFLKSTPKTPFQSFSTAGCFKNHTLEFGQDGGLFRISGLCNSQKDMSVVLDLLVGWVQKKKYSPKCWKMVLYRGRIRKKNNTKNPRIRKGHKTKSKLHPMKYWLGLKLHPNNNQKNKGGN